MEHVLYPVPVPIVEGRLPVDRMHDLAWSAFGSATGKPILFLHGGPGSGYSVDHLRVLDPSRYRIIAYDQRGSGKSLPLASVENNTTPDLIADIEKLRVHFGIERWIVFGGSWGSTLALAYAEAHPDRVSALVLRGVWLCRQSDIDWWLYGLRHIHPEEWQRFSEHIPAAERSDLLSAYHRQLMDEDPAVNLPAARVWKSYESNCTRLAYDAAQRRDLPEDQNTLAKARIEAHYLKHHCFMRADQLTEDAVRIRHIPAYAVHGRYDVICPIDNSLALKAALPDLDLTIVPDAGHAAGEKGTAARLLQIMEELKS